MLCKEPRKDGSALVITPELSICGYGCLDAFLELDTEMHSWEVLQELLASEVCRGIIVDVGMPVRYKSVLYNCRVLFYNHRILYIRPKLSLANSGLFRGMYTLTRLAAVYLLTTVRDEIFHALAGIWSGASATTDQSPKGFHGSKDCAYWKMHIAGRRFHVGK